jgi:hypothetical protein
LWDYAGQDPQNLEANEDYYGGAPAMKRVVFVKMDSEDVRLAAAQAGQVDITLTSVLASVMSTFCALVLRQNRNQFFRLLVDGGGLGRAEVGLRFCSRTARTGPGYTADSGFSVGHEAFP